MRTRQRPAWKSWLACGAVVLLVALVGGGLLVTANWERVSGALREARETFGGLFAVQQAVQAHTGLANVRVHVDVHSDREGHVLRIEIQDASAYAEQSAGGAGARARALGIATVARDALASDREPTSYTVRFLRSAGGVIQVSNWVDQQFLPADLPPRAPPSAPAADAAAETSAPAPR